VKGFVIPTKSFVKIGIAKIFCYYNKIFSSVNKTLVAAAKFLVAATKILFVVPNFIALTKPFFSVSMLKLNMRIIMRYSSLCIMRYTSVDKFFLF